MRPGALWLLTSVLLSLLCLAAFARGPVDDWALRSGGPGWSVLSAGLAHWNVLHLSGNLAGLAVLALLGRRAGLPPRAALAWLAAGPLAHALLALHPELPPYAGLSAWLHAGVAVATVELLWRPGRERWIGAGIGIGLLIKLLLEQPWGPLLRPGDWWGGATLPLAHAVGAAAGLLCALLARGLRSAAR